MPLEPLLFCGIDGGGTTTSVVLCNEKGEILHTLRSGSINHYGIGMEKAVENYRTIGRSIETHFGRLPDFTYIGSSALDDKADEDTKRMLIDGIFDLDKCTIHSDVYIALFGHTLGKEGALLIAGTGSMACALDVNGGYHTCGGWGQTLGDEGSGYHLGLMGIQSVLRSSDGIAPQTELTSRLSDFYQLSQLSDLIELVYNPPIEKSRIAAFAIEVEKAALCGDTVATRLLNDEVNWLCKIAESITHKSNSNTIGLYGSMLVKSPYIGKEVISRLANKGIVASYPQFKPEIGALMAALVETGIALNPQMITNLIQYNQ